MTPAPHADRIVRGALRVSVPYNVLGATSLAYPEWLAELAPLPPATSAWRWSSSGGYGPRPRPASADRFWSPPAPVDYPARVLDLVEELRALLDALGNARVEFAVCGGLAVAIHAQPRATMDVDLLVAADQLEGAKRVARELGYRIEAGPLVFKEGKVVIHRLSKPDPETGDLLSLDLLVVTSSLVSVWETRERIEWTHGSVPVVSRAGLIAMKRLRGSGQDRDDIRNLQGNDDGNGD